MKEVKIYLNKISKLTITLYAILGLIYLIIGISSIINGHIITGIIHIVVVLIASTLLIFSSLPKYSKQLYFAINSEKISIKKFSFIKPRIIYWKEIISISIKEKKIIFYIKNKRRKVIRLNDLEYDEQIYFKKGINSFIQKYKITKN